MSLISPVKAQKKLADHTRARRLQMKLTQEGLATRSGVALRTLRKFEQEGSISLASFLKLYTVSNYTDKCRAILFLDIQKPSSRLVRGLDNFFMKLVQFSPKFRKANVSARGLK